MFSKKLILLEHLFENNGFRTSLFPWLMKKFNSFNIKQSLYISRNVLKEKEKIKEKNKKNFGRHNCYLKASNGFEVSRWRLNLRMFAFTIESFFLISFVLFFFLASLYLLLFQKWILVWNIINNIKLLKAFFAKTFKFENSIVS